MTRRCQKGLISIVTLVLHMLFCLFVMLIVLAAPTLIISFIPNSFSGFIASVLFCLSIILHIAFIAYYYISNRYNIFALPLSNIIFPILFFLVTYPFRWILSQNTGSLWEGFVAIVAMYYFLPIAAITFIISLIMKLRQ